MTLEARHAILDALLTVLDADHAEAVLDHRKGKKSPLTAFAAKLLAKEFGKCPDPNAAAEEMILRGWAGFRADWMARPQGRAGKRTFADAARDKINGRRNANGSHSDAQRFSDEQYEPGPDAGHLRIGYAGPFVNSRH